MKQKNSSDTLKGPMISKKDNLKHLHLTNKLQRGPD